MPIRLQEHTVGDCCVAIDDEAADAAGVRALCMS